MDAKPERRRWSKRRWWAVILLWLLVAYPLSEGPAMYCYMRGWLPGWFYLPVYYPINATANSGLSDAVGLSEYRRWWANRGFSAAL